MQARNASQFSLRPPEKGCLRNNGRSQHDSPDVEDLQTDLILSRRNDSVRSQSLTMTKTLKFLSGVNRIVEPCNSVPIHLCPGWTGGWMTSFRGGARLIAEEFDLACEQVG